MIDSRMPIWAGAPHPESPLGHVWYLRSWGNEDLTFLLFCEVTRSHDPKDI